VTVQKALTLPVVYDRCQALSQAVGALPWVASIANRTDLRRAATSTRWHRVLRPCTTPSSGGKTGKVARSQLPSLPRRQEP
jgi:hypothetical protein